MWMGVEIGGTKLQVAVANDAGEIGEIWRATVDAGRGGEGIRHRLAQEIPSLTARFSGQFGTLKAIGVGYGGPVDSATGTTICSHQIHGWENIPLAGFLADVAKVPCVVGNDADVAGLGEAERGAGRGVRPMFYTTVGSGIGGGLILEGVGIHPGAGLGSAEVGHLRLSPGGPIVEEIGSGWGMQRHARKALDAGETSILSQGKPEEVTVPAIAKAAQAGDALAKRVLQDGIDALGFGLAQVMAIACPKRLVVGGGVSLLGEEIYLAPLRESVCRQTFAPYAHLVDLVGAELGEEVVLHGAVALAMLGRFQAG